MSNLERLRTIPGLTPTDICVELATLAKQVPAGEAIIEIGVHKGRTACYLAHGARRGNRAHVYAIDPWDLPGHNPPRRVRRLKFASPVTRQQAKATIRKQGMRKHLTLIQDFSTEVAARWSGPPVGLLYVDGDHSYESVRGDLLGWAPRIAPGAVIAFDDYADSHPDVPRAVDQLVEEGILQPVIVRHDRLAVTSLTSTAPAEQWIPELVADEAVEESQPEPETKAEEDVQESAGISTPEEESEPETDVEPATDETTVDVQVEVPGESPVLPDPPPRAGSGSGRGAWIDYAVKVTSRPESHWATLSRAEIINELERMKVA